MDSMTISLIQIGNQLTRTMVPVIIIIGVVSNLLNIIILTRPTLYKHACSCYFLAHAYGNIFYLSVVLMYRLLADQYNINPAATSVEICKMVVYVSQMGIFLAPNFLVLASIDRWRVSSINARIRNFSSFKTAKWIIFLTIILFAIFFSNSAISADLRDTDPLGCTIRADTLYKQIYVFIQAYLMSFISPCLMAFFGMMTICNIKARRIRPVRIVYYRRIGRQLTYMLLLQVGCHIILTISSSITYLIFVLPNNIKTTTGFAFASLLSVLPFHLSYITPFFLYMLSSQAYRREFVRFINQIFQFGNNIRVYPLLNTPVIQTLSI